jgi:serine/threonine-protein kinase
VKQFVKRILAWILDRPYKPGTLIHNRYQVIKVLGMGSYGIAYLVNDNNQPGLQFVLKQVKPSKRNGEGTRFLQYETRIMKELNHPQIPKLQDQFVFHNHQFIVMDYVNGDNFEDLIFKNGNKFNEIESFSILRELLEIIRYIHSKKLIHRDIRIPNVMISGGKLFLIDFGLARYLNDTDLLEIESSKRSEMKRLRREISYQSDFYSLGHFMLFLLYSTYEPTQKQERSWEEELTLTFDARRIIRRLLQIDEPYEHVEDLIFEVDQYLNAYSRMENNGLSLTPVSS